MWERWGWGVGAVSWEGGKGGRLVTWEVWKDGRVERWKGERIVRWQGWRGGRLVRLPGGRGLLVLLKGGEVSPRFHLFVSNINEWNEGARWLQYFLAWL